MATVRFTWESQKVVIEGAPMVTGWRIALVDLGTSGDDFEQDLPLTPLTGAFSGVPDGTYEARVDAIDAEGNPVGNGVAKAIELADGVLVPDESGPVDQPHALMIDVTPDAPPEEQP